MALPDSRRRLRFIADAMATRHALLRDGTVMQLGAGVEDFAACLAAPPSAMLHSWSNWLNKVCMAPPVLVTGGAMNGGTPRYSPKVSSGRGSSRIGRSQTSSQPLPKVEGATEGGRATQIGLTHTGRRDRRCCSRTERRGRGPYRRERRPRSA